MRVAALVLGVLGGLAGLWIASYGHLLLTLMGVAGLKASDRDLMAAVLWALPIASIVGGCMAPSNARVGGNIMALSAGGWLLLGWMVNQPINFITAGPLFFTGIGALLAIFAGQDERPLPIVRTSEPDEPRPYETDYKSYDQARWEALVKYDEDIGRIAEKIRPLGTRWVDEFAVSYLALNDKSYLPSIIQKIIAQAKEEEQDAKEAEAARIARIERQNEQWRRSAPERKRKLVRNWTIAGCVALLAVLGWGAWKLVSNYEDAQTSLVERLRGKAGSRPAPSVVDELSRGSVPEHIVREHVSVGPAIVVVSESEVPAEVRATRDRLFKAASSGNFETLRAMMDVNGDQPYLRYSNGSWGFELGWGQSDAEKAEFLRGLMWTITQPAGLAKDTYVWPYWGEMEASALSSDQRAEMVESRMSATTRNFNPNWRLKINDAGRWISFLK